MEKKKLPWKEILGGAYIALTVGVIVVLGIFNQSFDELFSSFAQFDPFWSVMTVLCVVAYYFLENYTMWYYLKCEGQKMGFFLAWKMTMIGQYYCALTPFSSGGQPMQIYYMHKNGVSVGTASSSMTVKVIIFNVCMVLTALVGVIYNFGYFLANAAVALPFAIAGIVLNSAVLTLFWVMFFNQKLSEKIVKGLISFLGKIRILRNPAATLEKADGALSEYFGSITFMKKNPKKMLWIFVTTWVQTLAMMSVSYCIYRAFGFQEEPPILFVTLQYVLFIAVSYVPLPGASGAQEIGFLKIYENILPEDKIFIMMMLWRFFTYIVSIIVGGVIIVWDQILAFLPKRKKE